MLGAARWTVVSALVAGWLLMPSAAFAIVPQVHDHGKFFKSETVKEADAILLKIQEKYKKDVVVETFDKIPDEVLQRFKYDPKDRKAFFHRWVADLVSQGKVNGVYVLICKDQNHDNSTWIEEEVGEHSRAAAFPETDRKELHQIFSAEWSKDRNAALLDGLRFIEN